MKYLQIPVVSFQKISFWKNLIKNSYAKIQQKEIFSSSPLQYHYLLIPDG